MEFVYMAFDTSPASIWRRADDDQATSNQTASDQAASASTATISLADLPHDNQAPQLNFTIWLLSGLSLGFLALRIYCKSLRGRGLWYDDYVLIVAWVCLGLASGFTTAATTFGYGRHLWDIPFNTVVQLNIVANVAGTFSILAALWSKTSFAMTVLRISTGWTRRSIWFIIMTLNVVLGASATFQWTKCVPVQRIFNGSVPGECWPVNIVTNYNTFATAYSGVMDIVLAMIPWKIIWGMSMNRKEKLGVLFAMSMGVFAGAASLIKVSKVGSLTNPDPSDTVQLVIWGVAESAITIIAASIPILRALLLDEKLAPAPASEAEIELNTADWAASVNRGSQIADSTTTAATRVAATATATATATNTTTQEDKTAARSNAPTNEDAEGSVPSWIRAPLSAVPESVEDKSIRSGKSSPSSPNGWRDDGNSRPSTTQNATQAHSLI